MIELALYQPEIPPNTGTTARHCAGLNVRLNLIGPIAFDLSDKAVRRAGLDYWEHVNLKVHETPEAFLNYAGGRKLWLVTKFGNTRYDQAAYGKDDIIICGNETRGLPEQWRNDYADSCINLPMLPAIRSFNLANSAAIVLMQAMSTSGLFDHPPFQSAPAGNQEVGP